MASLLYEGNFILRYKAAATHYTVVTADGTEVRAADGTKIGANWDLLKGKIDAALSGAMLP